jgi:hypothetical protein
MNRASLAVAAVGAAADVCAAAGASGSLNAAAVMANPVLRKKVRRSGCFMACLPRMSASLSRLDIRFD